MIDSGVEPQAILGDIITGLGSEPIRSAIAKYNQHDHQRAGISNFYTSGIQPEQIVEVVTNCLDPILLPDTIVKIVKENQLELNTTALKTIDGAILQTDNLAIYNTSLVQDSSIVTLQSSHGFIQGDQVANLSKIVLTGHLNNLFTVTYPLLIESPYSGYIRAVHFVAPLGQVEFELVILDSMQNVLKSLWGQTVVSFYTHNYFDMQTDVSNSYLNKGETIGLIINNNTSDSVLSYTIEIVQTLKYDWIDYA
jgi:hypothetical protein